MPLEELHFPLVPLRRAAAFERAEISAPARSWIFLARIESIPARFQSPDHLNLLRKHWLAPEISGRTAFAANGGSTSLLASLRLRRLGHVHEPDEHFVEGLFTPMHALRGIGI